MKLTVYTPESSLIAPGRMWAEMMADLRASRNLAWRLAVRDIRAQYRGSYLGVAWAFATPLISTLVWVFLSMSGVVRVAQTEIPYPAYVFTGTMLWQIFTESINGPLVQISGARSMLAKLNFPRESLILSGALKVLFNAGVKLLILVPAVMAFGVVPDAGLLLAPIAMLAMILLGTAVGLLLAPVGTLYTDVGRLIQVFTQVLMYLTPVVFAMPAGGTMARLFLLNPATPIILTGRAWLTGGEAGVLPYFMVVLGGSLLLLLFGWAFFRITMQVLIERMSS